MGYYLYILRSESSGRYYIGSSEDPQRRLSYHNTIEKGFTSRYRPWRIVYLKEYAQKKEAQAAERKVKLWKSKIIIERVIQGQREL